jgi:hypothetical protein
MTFVTLASIYRGFCSKKYRGILYTFKNAPPPTPSPVGGKKISQYHGMEISKGEKKQEQKLNKKE